MNNSQNISRFCSLSKGNREPPERCKMDMIKSAFKRSRGRLETVVEEGMLTLENQL